MRLDSGLAQANFGPVPGGRLPAGGRYAARTGGCGTARALEIRRVFSGIAAHSRREANARASFLVLRVRAGAYFAAHANSSLQSGLGLNAAPPLCPPSPARAPKRVLFPGGVRTAARSGDPAGPLAPPAPFPSGHLCTPKPCSHACRLAPWRSSRPCYFSGSRRTRRGTSGSSSCRLPALFLLPPGFFATSSFPRCPSSCPPTSPPGFFATSSLRAAS